MVPRSRKYDPANTLRYYRCTGADGYRFNGKAVCRNGPVRGDQLEQVVWDQVRSLLEEPDRVADEYRRRIGQAHDGAAMPDKIVRLNHQMTTMGAASAGSSIVMPKASSTRRSLSRALRA